MIVHMKSVVSVLPYLSARIQSVSSAPNQSGKSANNAANQPLLTETCGHVSNSRYYNNFILASLVQSVSNQIAPHIDPTRLYGISMRTPNL